MLTKLALAAEQYSLITLLLGAASGWGLTLTRHLFVKLKVPGLTAFSLIATAGLGTIILLCIVAGVLHQLKLIAVVAIIGVGLLLLLSHLAGALFRQRFPVLAAPMRDGQSWVHGGWPSISWPQLSWKMSLLSCALIVYALRLLAEPLQISRASDELMYHLPTARAWAEAGSLIVTEQLRYPLFPFNMEVLYAAALLVGDELTTHMVHALTGALTLILIFSLARLLMPWQVALLAALLLADATKAGWHTAYVDVGVMLFVFCSFAALALRYHYDRERFCYLAAFFLGLALGTKYQALFYLPAWAVTILLIERRWVVLAQSALLTASVCGYWYLRNYLVSGDPIHPVGGPVFGFWLWSVDDLNRQFEQLQTVRDWPPVYLLSGMISVVFWRSMPSLLRGCLLVSTASLCIWYWASGYPRYLFPLYPMLAILSAYFIWRLFQQLAILPVTHIVASKIRPSVRDLSLAVVLIYITIVGANTFYKKSQYILPDQPARDAFLRQEFAGYDLLQSLGHSLTGTLYQYGFEGEIYYLGNMVIGDWPGTARYSTIHALRDRPAALASHLHMLGAQYFLVPANRGEFFSVPTKHPDFAQHFRQIHKTTRAALYQLANRPEAGGLPVEENNR